MVSIIILSYNTASLLRACLKSLYTNLNDFSFEVIVVDNNSSDKSVETVKKEFPKALLIQNKENQGFSKGNNTGVKYAKGDQLLFLNSDVAVADDSIKEMAAYLDQDSSVGIVGGKLTNIDGSKQRSFGSFYGLYQVFMLLFLGNKWENIKFTSNKTHSVDWVSGAFMLIRKDLFEKIGGFDEKLFMYVEDVELCYRVKKEGHGVVYLPSVVAQHAGQGSSNRTFAITHIYKGLRYFYKKHKTPFEYAILEILLGSKALVAIIVGSVTKNTYLKTTYKDLIVP